MKKISLFLMGLILCMGMMFTSCESCNRETNEPAVEETAMDSIDSVNYVYMIDSAELNLENAIAMDREYMFLNYGGNYRWFESCVLLKNYLDEENDGSIAGISNVFQVVNESENGADVFVVLIAHTPDTTAYDLRHGFWVEDCPMNDDTIAITYAQAFELMNQVNCPKAHSKNCVLRKPLGPQDCNPQYIFGNVDSQVWVDATTGEIRESNPAFPEDNE